MTTDELTCRELVELVTDHLEGVHEPDEARRFAEHLDACGGCRAYLDQMRTTIAISGRVERGPLPLDLRARLLDAYRAWVRTGGSEP